MTHGIEHFEVVDGFEIFQNLLQLGLYVELIGMLVVVQERPELFQSVHLSRFVILKRVGLEILVHLRPEFFLQPVAEKPKQALQSVSEKQGIPS